MRRSCPQADQWLRSTLVQLLGLTSRQHLRRTGHLPTLRHVSTTSAIKRGLRAESEQKEQSQSRSRRKQESSSKRGEPRGAKGEREGLIRPQHSTQSRASRDQMLHPYDEDHARDDPARREATSENFYRRNVSSTFDSAPEGQDLFRQSDGDPPHGVVRKTRDPVRIRSHSSKAESASSWLLRERAKALHGTESQAHEEEKGAESGRDVPIDDGTEESGQRLDRKGTPWMGLVRKHRSIHNFKAVLTDDEIFPSENGRLNTVPENQPVAVHNHTKEDTSGSVPLKRLPKTFTGLSPLMRKLREIEVHGIGRTGEYTATESELRKLLGDLYGTTNEAREIKYVLSKVLGAAATHASGTAEQLTVGYWTRSWTTARDTPRSMIWLPREKGAPQLVVGRQMRDSPIVGDDASRPVHSNDAERMTRKREDRPDWDELKGWMEDKFDSIEKSRKSADHRNKANSGGGNNDMPISVPYTTAASTFVYGTNSVLASLSARRRKFYHLYLHHASMNEKSEKRNLDQIRSLADAADTPTTTNTSKALLDKMSSKRPHNGVVLEASPVPAPPVLGLGKPDKHLSIMPVQLDRQSAEDVVVNGAPTALPTLTSTWRQPFILMLDGVLDEGNMGNIIRTAYFYGVDAIAVSKNTCASVNSSVVSKASSGAIEAVQILSLPFPTKFVNNCLRASWKVYAAVSPPMPGLIPPNEKAKYLTHSSISARSPLENHPCILMLGAEGEGLRENLRTKADYFVSIEHGRRAEGAGAVLPGIGVDSMNVSSAAGVLVESFMRQPAGVAGTKAVGNDLGF